MHPPTPYPASARTKSRMRDTAFREITARANAVSKSEQDFLSVMKKEEVTGKPSKTGIASRRYSVASKFGGPKADNASALSSGIAAGEAKPKLNKRTSFLGVVKGPQFNGTSTQASLASSITTAAPSEKTTTNRPAAPSLQETNLASLPKRQSLVPEQAIKLHKPTLDLRKRSVSGYEKAESTHANKARGMLLKSACYWLEQVKLAEVMEKHGVSAGFFRLAVECEAEPVELLREELIAYIKRHSLWSNAIQQVLLCYGVTDEAQYTLFSELSAANCIIDSSSPCTPAKNLEGMLPNGKYPAGQVPEKDPKSSDANLDNTTPNGTVEESNIKEEVLHSQKTPVPDASGHIESMDVDSITREVVSYIMSSMNHPESSKILKNDVLAGPKDSMFVSSDQDNRGSSALLVAEDPVLRVQESISILNSADPEEAISTGSLPSLDIWNTSSNEVDSGKLDVQEEVSITLDNEINDSVSTEKVTGEEMCVSMELDVDDTTSDNLSELQSKSPTYQGASSEESNCHASQTANDTHDNVVNASDVNRSSHDAISADDNYEGLSKSLIHEKSHDKVFETVQVSEKCVSGSHKGRKIKSESPKAEFEKCTAVQTNPVPESQGKRRSSSSFGRRSQNGKEKSAPASDKKKTEVPAPKKDNGAQNSRRISISTPKSSTSAYVPNIEAGSRTRRKPRISQLTEPGIGSNHMHLKSPIVAPEGIFATPRQERTVEVGDGAKQVSLNIVEGMDGGNTDFPGSMATPGSAGVRRSARLMRPFGGTTMSTPGFVSTPRVQRQLGTPMKAEKEML